MTNSIEKKTIVFSVAGWIVAVAAVTAGLFVIKPYYYQQGYEKGKKDQYSHDTQVVQEYLNAGPRVDSPRTQVEGQVLEVKADQVVISNGVPSQNNPLVQASKSQTVLVDGKTKILRRIPLTQKEFMDANERARKAGKDPAMVLPWTDQAIKLADLKAGDQVMVLPRVQSETRNTSFMADEIDVMTPQPQHPK